MYSKSDGPIRTAGSEAASATALGAGSLFSEITGPFDEDRGHAEYVRCLRNRAGFTINGLQSTCSGLLQLQHQFAMAINWDHIRCKHFVPDPLESVFLEPAHLRFRSGSRDGPTIRNVFCGEEGRYLALLSQHLPSDRPLTALDAGADIGMDTLMLTRYNKFHGKILAVTSNRDNMQLLRVNTDNMTHIVSRMHGMIVPEPLAQQAAALSETAGTLRRYLGRADFDRFRKQRQETAAGTWYEGLLPPGSGEIPEGDLIPTLSLRRLRDFLPTRRFDIVRLDMFSAAAHLLRDPASREILCQSSCLVVATRTPSAAAAKTSAALKDFERRGCPPSHRLVHVGSAGKYDVLCQEKAAAATRQRAKAAAQSGNGTRT